MSASASVAWVPFGPATPGTPTQPASWYGTLAAHRPGDCAQVRSLATPDPPDYPNPLGDPKRAAVYLAAADACLALDGGTAADWAGARAALHEARGATTLDCLDMQAYRLGTELVAAHDVDPAVPVRTGPATRATACPYGVTAMTPTSGAPGTTVTISGHYLWAGAVYFGNSQASILDAGRDGVEVEAPETTSSGAVQVRVVSSYQSDGPAITPFTATSPQDFTYLPTASASAPGEPSTTSSAPGEPSTTSSAPGQPSSAASPTASAGSTETGSSSGTASLDGRTAARRPRE